MHSRRYLFNTFMPPRARFTRGAGESKESREGTSVAACARARSLRRVMTPIIYARRHTFSVVVMK